jgi:hypothetical protein
MWRLACALVLASFAVSACSLHQSTAASSARTTPTTTSTLAPASGQLDAEVAMPPGFPSDFPIYPRARLTAGAAFTSSGQMAWGMEWETLDGQPKVQAYYMKQLAQGDWTLNITSAPQGAFAGTFARKSDSSVAGTIAANWDVTLTRILVSLVSTG